MQDSLKLIVYVVFVSCTWVHDVSEIELEVVAAAVADIDGAAGSEARSAGSEYGAAPGVAL